MSFQGQRRAVAVSFTTQGWRLRVVGQYLHYKPSASTSRVVQGATLPVLGCDPSGGLVGVRNSSYVVCSSTCWSPSSWVGCRILVIMDHSGILVIMDHSGKACFALSPKAAQYHLPLTETGSSSLAILGVPDALLFQRPKLHENPVPHDAVVARYAHPASHADIYTLKTMLTTGRLYITSEGAGLSHHHHHCWGCKLPVAG